MYIWTFFLVFFFFVALAAFIGVMKARKYKWQLSVSRIIISIVSLILAALTTSLVSSSVIINVFGEMFSSLFTLPEEFAGLIPSGLISSVIIVFAVMVMATLIFIPIYWIIRAILSLFRKLLAKGLVKLSKDSLTPVEDGEKKKNAQFRLEKGNWISAVCGGACGVLTMLIMAIPMVGLTSTLGNMVLPTLKHMPLEPETAEIIIIADEAVNNPGTAVVNALGGGAIYDMMTYCRVDENTDTTTVKQDITTVTTVVDAVVEYNVVETAMNGDFQTVLANEDCTYKIIAALLKNPRISFVVDLLSDRVIESFLLRVNVPATTDELYSEFLQEMQFTTETDFENLYSEYDYVFDKYGLRVDDSIKIGAANAKLAGADMSAWVAQNVVADKATFVARTECVVIKDVIDGSVQITDAEREAKALAHAIATICSFDDDVNSSAFDVKGVIKLLGPILDSFAETQTLGKTRTEYLLKGILQSRLVYDKVGLSVLDAADTAQTIKEGSDVDGYNSVMGSLSDAVEVVENASGSDKSSNESVKKLITNLTPATAPVLQAIAKPSVMRNYGVPKKSAEPVADVVSNTFKNLSDAKEMGMSEEEYEKEAAAVSNMMDIIMNADKLDTRSMFGESSITGVSASEYVNNIMDSTVMSKTIVEKVYEAGEDPAKDPLNSGIKLKAEEKSDLMTSLNDRWDNSEKDEATKKEIVSVAAIMNLQIIVTDSGVYEAATQI